MSADFFQNQFFQNNYFRNTISVNSLDPDQARHFVVHDVGPNCLQKVSADDNSEVYILTLHDEEFFIIFCHLIVLLLFFQKKFIIQSVRYITTVK